MSDTFVSLLTPPGKSALASISLSGTRAWEFALVVQPLKIKGATGSTVAPTALR